MQLSIFKLIADQKLIFLKHFLSFPIIFLVAMKESWLEIYRVPKETWIKEVDAALIAFAPSSRKPTLDSVTV